MQRSVIISMMALLLILPRSLTQQMTFPVCTPFFVKNKQITLSHFMLPSKWMWTFPTRVRQSISVLHSPKRMTFFPRGCQLTIAPKLC